MKTHRVFLWSILGIAFLLRVSVLFLYGSNFNLNSDDYGYQVSAITFLQSGTFTYHFNYLPTSHIMPGITVFLSVIFFFFGTAKLGILAAKFAMICFGVGSVYMTYLLGEKLGNKQIGYVSALLLACFPPIIAIDNFILTESPYCFFTLTLFYLSIKLSETHNKKYFTWILIVYFITLYFRVHIALFPILLVGFLLIKRYPIQLLLRQLVISVFALLLVLSPWWVRNYVQFHQFIPLTSGSGNPLLLGTYQGEGHPPGPHHTIVTKKIREEHPNLKPEEYMALEKEYAQNRMKDWWEFDKWAMIRSYMIIKPTLMWETSFYPKPIFHIPASFVHSMQKVIMVFFLLSSVFLFAFKNRNKTIFLFLFSFLLLQTFLNSYYYAYDRYTLTLMPFVFIFISSALLFFTTNNTNRINKQKTP